MQKPITNKRRKTAQTNSTLQHFHISDWEKHSALLTLALSNTYTKTQHVDEWRNNNVLSGGCRLEAEPTVIPPETRSSRARWRTDEPAPWQQRSVWTAWRPKIAKGRRKNYTENYFSQPLLQFLPQRPICYWLRNSKSRRQFHSQTAGGSRQVPGCATVWFLGISVPSGWSMIWDCQRASLPHWANRSLWQGKHNKCRKLTAFHSFKFSSYWRY